MTADIFHDFPIRAPIASVYRAISTPVGLDLWWTARAAGVPQQGAEYQLWFGPEYDWRARVVRCEPDRAFELELTSAMPDWAGTRVSFVLDESPDGTRMRFSHTGWPSETDHFRVSSFCWAMYLRILRRNLEFGETVAYDQRLEV